MIRYNLVEGDKSTANGTIVEGMPFCTVEGRRIAFLGAQVYCPACKTTGQIVGAGPRRPNNWLGQQEALEGDTCVCKCHPPPVMIASQRLMSHSFAMHELAAMGFGPSGGPPERAAHTSDDGPQEFDEQVQLSAPAGYEIAGMRYLIQGADGSIKQGTVPADGTLPRIFTSSESTYTVLWGDQAAAEDET